MNFFSAYSEQCLLDAQKYSIVSELNKLVDKIEKNQTSRFLEKFNSPAVVKRAGAYRFVGYELIIGDIIFIIFLRILLKSKNEYKNFCNDSDGFCRDILPEQRWILDKIEEKNRITIKEIPHLTEMEKKYLFTPLYDDTSSSLMIYESKKFVEEIYKSDYKLYFEKIIMDILEDKNSSKNIFKQDKQKSDLIIYYKIFKEYNILFLYQALDKKTKEKFDEEEFLRIINSFTSVESIMKVSFRTYPDYILYDDSIWLDIQKDSEGNLALSTEEANILNSIIYNKDKEPLFPLFINGRAGSGKSTLLYYIFSHILLNHIIQEEKLKFPPLFLTYSSRLLETASSNIKKILKTNSKIRLQIQNKSNGIVLFNNYLNSPDFDKSFKTFREFQRELLKPELQNNFCDKYYCGFSKFKEDWSNDCKKNPSSSIRQITSEFAWYVIRTFIKGMRTSQDDFLELEDYLNLPRDLKTVDINTYKIIYEDVFLGWYKDYLKKNKFWDDQDLTRCVLDNLDEIGLEYPAVFCDEAQDFSNIEIELISSLSLFSRRKMNPTDYKKIPLAFAGDPLQTINPTGFSWSRIKANYYEKINTELDRNQKVKINFRELNNNYRSNKPIVVFNNIIQLIRAILFRNTDITPQKAWFISNYTINPTIKINDSSIIKDSLKDENKTKTIIIPCEEDQERDFIQNRDSFLKKHAFVGNEIAQNIWSPMNVKGLEYNTVIVYNFGDYLATTIGINLTQILTNIINTSNIDFGIKESNKIQLEYFLNKLYVATSRAKKNLVIVDTEIGKEFLWSIFYNLLKDLPVHYSLNLNDKFNWDEENDISEFQFSTEILELADDKPEDLAKQYYFDGIKTLDSRKLKTAANYYKFAQNITESNRSFAKAYELENNYIKAAEYYEKIQDGDTATQCIWLTKNNQRYSKILDIYNRLPKNPNNIFQLASDFMVKPDKKNNSILFLRNLYKLINNNKNLDFYLLTDSSWEETYDNLMKSLVSYSSENSVLSDWDEVVNIIRELLEKGLMHKTIYFIHLLFNLRKYKEVIDIKTSFGETNDKDYNTACAEFYEYPDNLKYLFKLKEFDRINNLYKSNLNDIESVNTEILGIIFKSLLKSNDTDLMNEFISKSLKKIIDTLNETSLEQLFKYCFDKKIFLSGFNIVDLLDNRIKDEFYINFLKNNLIKKDKDKNLINYIILIFIYQEFKYNRYHTVLDILENKTIEFQFIPNDFINYALLDKFLLYNLAKIEKITAKSETKKRMQDYIKNLLVNTNKWKNLCGVQIAGAAIEKLEYHINSRDFYKKIIKDDFTLEDQEFAKLRWLKVKEKQARNSKDEKIKQKLFEDIGKKFKNWDLEYEIDIPDFPKFDDKLIINFDESYYGEIIEGNHKIDLKITPSKITCSIDGEEFFAFRKISDKNLIKIDNLKKEETIYFEIGKNEIRSEEIDNALIKFDAELNEFKITNWDLNIILDNIPKNKILHIYYKSINNPLVKIRI